MGETILLIAVLLLSLYGCVELVRCIAMRVLWPGKSAGGILVLPISGHRSDVEYVVRSAACRNRWVSEMSEEVLLLDAGMDEETRLLAQNVCRQYDNVRMGTMEDFEKMFVLELQ